MHQQNPPQPTPGWTTHAKCATERKPLSFFFPTGQQIWHQRQQIAKYCSTCPVKHDCAIAGANEIGGWGGIYHNKRSDLTGTELPNCQQPTTSLLTSTFDTNNKHVI
jgi:hypothetical protein